MTDPTRGQGADERRIVAYATLDSAHGVAARRLSEDFERALTAYEELSQRQLSRPTPQLVAVQIERPGTVDAREGGAQRAEARPLKRLVVIAGDPDTARSDMPAALALLAQRGMLAADTRIWGIVATERPRPDDAAEALAEFGRALGDEDGAWMGGVAVGGSPLALPEAGRPRMGRLRERASVAIDGLIGAVRCDLSLDEAAPLFGFETEHGVLTAPIGISRAEYLLRARIRTLL